MGRAYQAHGFGSRRLATGVKPAGSSPVTSSTLTAGGSFGAVARTTRHAGQHDRRGHEAPGAERLAGERRRRESPR